MSKIPPRDIAESVAGLRDTAKDLRSAAATSVQDGGAAGPVVVMRMGAVMNHAAYLDQVANELTMLIPDTPIKPLK